MSDTIVAIASPLGNALHGIIRLSGPAAFDLVRKFFRATIPQPGFSSYYTTKGLIYLKEVPGGIPCELYLMKAPRSYTREDVVEIHTVGNLALLNLLLDEFIKKGARLAEPGEFTRRAFLNGRIDLAQAEAVLEIIRARNEKELILAQHHLQGRFSEQINHIRSELIDLLARLELSLDFSDQDIEIIPPKQISTRIKKLLKSLSRFLSSEKTQNVIKDGILTVICGRPNVGKSSLFNRLLSRKKAIVHHLAGTTTDVIEDNLKLGGITFRIFDTAGLGNLTNQLEYEQIHKEAQQRTRSLLERADLFLWVVDGHQGFTQEDRRFFEYLPLKRTVVIINKIDLPQKISPVKLRALFNDIPYFFQVSALSGQGINQLKKYLKRVADKIQLDKSVTPEIINFRHQANLSRVSTALKRAQEISPEQLEIIALELREALNALGEITGDIVTDEILNHIFSRFCIGK